MKRMLMLTTLGAATLAAQMLGAGTSCITKVGSTEVESVAAAAALLEEVSTASSATAASVAGALEGGIAAAAASLDSALEGGIAVWDVSNVTDCDFTPGGMLFVIR